MPNAILTATGITREALRVLHQKLNFIGTIVREYDKRFAVDGAKVGDTLKIRIPNQYVVRTGAVLGNGGTMNETKESSVELKVTTQKGVDLNFTSTDLTLSLDDFSDRILEPAMSVLAASMEADAMTMYKDVWNQVSNIGAAATFLDVLKGRKMLVDNLASLAGRTCNLNTQDNMDLVDAIKAMFNDSSTISKQNKEGFMGRTAGFDFMENTLWPRHIRGAANAAYAVNGANQTGAGLIVSAGTGAMNRGEIFTLPGVFKVHPETKAITTELQQFVVTTDWAGGAGTIAIQPSIIVTGAYQTVSNSPTTTNLLTFAGTISSNHGISMAYQKTAFAFATADLVMPKGVDFSSRENFDGVSMRIVRQYDINNDAFPCRLDVLYGFKTVRPQLAARLAFR